MILYKNYSKRKENKVCIEFIALVLIQQFVSSEILYIFSSLILILYILKNNGILFKAFQFQGIIIGLFLWGLFMGVISAYKYKIGDILRDVFYFTGPIIYIYIGAFWYKKKYEFEKIYNSIITSAMILSIFHLIRIAIVFIGRQSFNSVWSYRKLLGIGYIIVPIALALLIIRPTPGRYKLSKKLNIVAFIACGIDFIVSMSRTNFVIFMILIVTFSLNIKIDKLIKSIIIILFGIIIIILIAQKLMPSVVWNDFINKILNTFTEMSSQNDWSNHLDIVANWRGYETFSAINEFRSASIFNKFFGMGFGKGIYVGEYAKLVGGLSNEIPILHNGYLYILIKTGILGFISYILFYICSFMFIIRKISSTKNLNDKYEYKLLLGILLIYLIISYFAIGMFQANCLIELCVLLGYIGRKSYCSIFRRRINEEKDRIY